MRVLECGRGCISRVSTCLGHSQVSSDVRPRSEGRGCQDLWLTSSPLPKQVDDRGIQRETDLSQGRQLTVLTSLPGLPPWTGLTGVGVDAERPGV